MGVDIIGLGSVADLVKSTIDKIWPDKTEAEKIKLQILQLEQAGQFKEMDIEFNLLLEQIKTNAVEAASTSLFVSGWRPAVGWVCVCGFLYTFAIQPLCSWVALIWKFAVPPVIDTSLLAQLLVGMLGMAGIRSWDKFKNINSK
jgi:hypothetical protein